MTIENEDGCDLSSSVDENSRRIVVGVCAMSKKAHSKPMKEILKRLSQFPYIQVVIFEESMILYDPIEEWPLCDSLISFYSGGFPLDKAISYARYRKPHLINDLESQYMLMDRQRVYEALKDNDVPVPRYSVLRRRSNGSLEGHKLVIHEHDDALEVDGNTFTKPFVEKPVDAEDHNIHIYFPHSAGGGSVRLFRKTDNRSSMYMKETNNIRQYGSYIYEEFMPTDGTDVKVYTVGDDYAHAEARKSPALDGRVERDSEGKEVRYPVILTPREKIIAKKVCQASRQQICGFDLLRANGMSYVCDVNGFSFVKSSKKYYDDCGHILGVMITRAVAPTLSIPVPRPLDNPPLVPTTYGTIMELRCVIAVIRHGDRTPKQKMKMEVKHPKFFEIFKKYDGYRMGELKLKKPKQLQELLDVCRSLLLELESGSSPDLEIEEKKSKLHQLRYVLELYGHFSGINRKVQFKYQPHGRPKRYSDDETTGEPSLLMVVKWGGELTDAGKQQAESLGRAFRCIYPGGDGNYGKDPGLGLLRLHSTYRHDLKIYASDEGRVQMTAAAFARGFLALEGELPPILAQMVKSAHTNGLLDSDNDCRKYQRRVKKKIAAVMSKETPFDETDYNTLAPNGSISLLNAMKVIGSPVRMCRRVQALVGNLVNRICQQYQSRRREPRRLYHGETWDLLQRRWCKLDKDFKCPDGEFDFSKVSDIYDNIKYDLQHNSHILDPAEGHELYQHAKYLADLIVPQEYGITKEEKLLIGQRICTPLMRKILADARYTDVEDTFTRLNSEYSKDVASPDRFVRTRLYFTSESHIHSLLTCLRFGGLSDPQKDEQWRRAMEYVSAVPELNYLSQIVIMIYEDPSQTAKTDERFHVELHFSPGAITVCKDLPRGSGYRPQSRERRPADNVSNSEGNTNPSTPGPTESFSSTDITKPQFILGDDEAGDLSDDEDDVDDDDESEVEAEEEEEVEVGPDPEPELAVEVATDACEMEETEEEKTSSKTPDEMNPATASLSRSDSQAASDSKAVTLSRNKYKIGRFECEDALVDDETPPISSVTPTAPRRHPKLDRRRGSGGESELSTDVSPVALDLNYLTYPGHAYPYPNLFALGVSKAGSSEMVNPRSVPNQGHLISTAVISGSNTMLPGSASSNSAPDLQKLEEDNLNVNGPESSDDIVTPSAPSVPDVYPLETLHNALTLHQLENFLEGLITTKMETPWASPVPPSTPSRSGAISRVEMRSSVGEDPNTSSEAMPTVFDTINNEGYILSRLEELVKYQSTTDKDV